MMNEQVQKNIDSEIVSRTRSMLLIIIIIIPDS